MLAIYAGIKALFVVITVIMEVHTGRWAQGIELVKPLGYFMYVWAFILFATPAGLYAFSIWKLYSGRSWARFLVLIVFIATFSYYACIATNMVRDIGFVDALLDTVLQTRIALVALHGYAVALLFSGACADWFRLMKHPGASRAG
jgi:hypothetical protein